MLNDLAIMGRLTCDPEIRYTQSGKAVASFALAVERDYKQNGERITDFFDCVAWGNTAEFMEKFFSKGRMAVISGRIETETWSDNSGKSRKSVKIIAEKIYFGDSKKDSECSQAPSQTGAAPNSNTHHQFAALEEDGDDGDFPF